MRWVPLLLFGAKGAPAKRGRPCWRQMRQNGHPAGQQGRLLSSRLVAEVLCPAARAPCPAIWVPCLAAGAPGSPAPHQDTGGPRSAAGVAERLVRRQGPPEAPAQQQEVPLMLSESHVLAYSAQTGRPN